MSAPDPLDQVPEPDRTCVAERAAILEYDGGLERHAAEQRALWWYRERCRRAAGRDDAGR